MKFLYYCNYDNSIPRNERMQYGVEFSFRKLVRRQILKPSLYCILFAPYSFCYVYFPFNTKGTAFKNYIEYGKKYPTYYMCDNTVFFDKMNEWNIQFEVKKLDKPVKLKNSLSSFFEEYLVVILYLTVRCLIAYYITSIFLKILW